MYPENNQPQAQPQAQPQTQEPAQQPAQQPAPQPTQRPQEPAMPPANNQQPPAYQKQEEPPKQYDPFAALMEGVKEDEKQPAAQQPAQQSQQQSQQPVPQQQPNTTVEPSSATQQQPQQPAQQPTQQPEEPARQPEPPRPQPRTEYERAVLAAMEADKNTPDLPDLTKVNPDDPKGVENFFKDYAQTIRQQVMAEVTRTSTLKEVEQKAWNESFEKYPSLKQNKKLRDTVQAIRDRHFRSGRIVSPTEAAQELVDTFGNSYKQGVAHSQVQQRVQQTQTNFGGGQPAPTHNSADDLKAVQTGGEQALIDILERQNQQ